jgi:GGDEF domain-containing protein
MTNLDSATLGHILDQVGEGIALLDEFEQFVAWNQTLERWSGLSLEDVNVGGGTLLWGPRSSVTTRCAMPSEMRCSAACRRYCRRFYSTEVFRSPARTTAAAFVSASSSRRSTGGGACFGSRTRRPKGLETSASFKLSTQLEAQDRALRAQRRAIQRASNFDPITGMANRARVLDHLRHALRRPRLSEETGAIVFIDIDGFKMVNELLGTEGGDLLLRRVATRLLRAAGPSDLVGRLGADDFVVVVDTIEHWSSAFSAGTALPRRGRAPLPRLRSRSAAHRLRRRRLFPRPRPGGFGDPARGRYGAGGGEASRPRLLQGLLPDDEPGGREPGQPQGRAVHGGRGGQLRAVLPAAGRGGLGRGDRRRGAPALESPRARLHLARGVRPHARRERLDPACGSLGHSHGGATSREVAGRGPRAPRSGQRVGASVHGASLRARRRRHPPGSRPPRRSTSSWSSPRV